MSRGEIEQELLNRAAKVPFDDRRNHHAAIGDLQLRLIQAHLQEVGSDLFHDAGAMPMTELCERLRIVDGPPEDLRPRNVALMFFADHPERWFDTAWIDVVHFPDGPSGDGMREKRFVGPIGAQLRAALSYIRDQFIEERVTKIPGRAEAERFHTYPFEAVEEALANAVYHRAYDVHEPIEVRITPEGMTITSYPGPDAGVAHAALNSGQLIARRYRNRRIGEFLKELHLTEGRGTGIPKIIRQMARNGSPPPRFEWDDARLSFTVTLLLHPGAAGPVHAIRSDEAVERRDVKVQRGLLDKPKARIILRFCREPRSRIEIGKHTKLTDKSHLLTAYINPLLAAGLLERTAPQQSRLQKFEATQLAEELLKR